MSQQNPKYFIVFHNLKLLFQKDKNYHPINYLKYWGSKAWKILSYPAQATIQKVGRASSFTGWKMLLTGSMVWKAELK